MADFDINSHLQRMGFGGGGGKSDGADDGVNTKSTIDALADNSGKTTYTAAKLVGLPINLSEFGQHGIQKALGGDTEGLTGKMIMPSVIPDAQGGFLAKLMHSIFVKNREVTDHTQNVGGAGASAGGGEFAAGGGGGGGSFSDMVGQAGSFAWSDVPMASLGNLPPPPLPSAGGPSQDMGVA